MTRLILLCLFASVVVINAQTKLFTSNIHSTTAHDEVLEKGILFHEHSKILLAEKFINVQFFIPFPNYTFSLRSEITQHLYNLSKLWPQPSLYCPLDFSSNFATNLTHFNVDWMLLKLVQEVTEAQKELSLIRNETSMFLRPASEKSNSRQRRGASVALAALAAVGLFGGGIAVGNSDSCGLRGIFGSCQDSSRANAENIDRLSDYVESLTMYVSELQTETSEKFFLIGNELASIQEIQNEIIKTQN